MASPFHHHDLPHRTSNTHGQPRRIPAFLLSLDNETRRANISASTAERFCPEDWHYAKEWTADDIVTEPQGYAFTYLSCPVYDVCPVCNRRVPHLDCLVVSVDGACSGNGKADFDVKAGLGICFRSNSMLNISMRLPDCPQQQHTNQQAELTAALLALQRTMEILEEGSEDKDMNLKDITNVIIKTDSQYVVNGMTEWIGKWLNNGFRTDVGMDVKNQELFLLLSKTVGLVQKRSNCKVYFWWVERKFNAQADHLAKQSLRS